MVCFENYYMGDFHAQLETTDCITQNTAVANPGSLSSGDGLAGYK